MPDAFKVEGPALLSVSGGRTSGYMLWRVLQSHGGALPTNVHPVFADTGKERAETYDFVREMADRWSAKIQWVNRAGYFDKLIADKKYLPNPVARFCTEELKVKPLDRFMRDQGYSEWLNVIGLRFDEPSRVARRKSREEDGKRESVFPLHAAGVTRADVMEFWKKQPFDLRLRWWESNCDDCFLKGMKIRERIARDHPTIPLWWIGKEKLIGATFRSDTPTYEQIQQRVQATPMLLDDEPEEGADHIADCVCSEAA